MDGRSYWKIVETRKNCYCTHNDRVEIYAHKAIAAELKTKFLTRKTKNCTSRKNPFHIEKRKTQLSLPIFAIFHSPLATHSRHHLHQSSLVHPNAAAVVGNFSQLIPSEKICSRMEKEAQKLHRKISILSNSDSRLFHSSIWMHICIHIEFCMRLASTYRISYSEWFDRKGMEEEKKLCVYYSLLFFSIETATRHWIGSSICVCIWIYLFNYSCEEWERCRGRDGLSFNEKFHILSFPLDSTIHYPNRPPNVNDDECNGCSQMHISLCFIVCSHFDLLPWTTKKSEQKRETSEHDMLHAFDKNENFGLSVQDEMRHLTSPNWVEE